MTNEGSTKQEEYRQRAYNVLPEVLAYEGLYKLCVENDPSTPVGDVIPLLYLEQRSIDPATPCREIFPPEVVAQGFKDVLNRWIDSWHALDSWSKQMVVRRLLRSEQLITDDMNRRINEIVRDMLLSQATKQAVHWKKMSDEEYQKFVAWWPKKGDGLFKPTADGGEFYAGWLRRSHTDQLTPAMKQILARLPDPHGAVRLAYRYLFAPANVPGAIQTALSSAARQDDDTPIRLNVIAEQLKHMDEPDVWAQIRQDVPALNALSNGELNVACHFAFAIKDMDDDEYFYFAEIFRMPPGAKDAGK